MPASWARAAERSLVNGHAKDVFPFTVTMPERWPECTKPTPSTLWTYLERGVDQGKLTRADSANRGNAFRYTRPGTKFGWGVDPYELLGV
jgi:hypothetical protein